MRAAATALKQRGVAACVVGVPVASPETCAEFRHEVDEVVCAATPEPFYGVGQFYEDFSQTSDEEVREVLARAATEKTQSCAPLFRGAKWPRRARVPRIGILVS